MAMTISVNIPSSPEQANTPPSTDGAQTPISPNAVQTLALPPPVDNAPSAAAADKPAPGQAKRKPSRRANTAERRATHNAVERQRRETLNGRFLDLAALLPNLSQIRRPSKSSIVNSSIAHIQASRRHRALASRELRLLKMETDALRRELNEWRDRSGLPRVEEPVRGEAFQMILSGEVEAINPGPIDEEDDGDYAGGDYGDEDYPINDHKDMGGLMKNDVTPFAHNVPTGGAPHSGLHVQTMLPRQSHGAPSPMIVQSPTAVSFENPAMMYDHAMHVNNQGFLMNGGGNAPHPGMFSRGGQPENDKVPGAWNMYGSMHGPQQFTPPTSSHGGNSSSQLNVPPTQQAAYLMNLQRQQAMLQSSAQGQATNMGLNSHGGHMYGSPVDGDDTSSVGSAPGNNGVMRRERSGSMNSVGSGYASNGNGGRSPPSSVSGSYEMPSVMSNGQGVPRRMNSGMSMGHSQWDENMGGMGGMGNMGGMGGMMKAAPAISVGGGGNAHAFAAMMM
ncbi:hypothetical protein QCA50_003701 [Cerrena zonata]|uniref:BHLH domain-containing protein n=1 Tax=Cerrena zonata TaxID=2478898 RepID=A0AAW0GLM0_9APHY